MDKAKRKAIIAGNWKMNKTATEAAKLVDELIPAVKDASCEVVICTPYTDLVTAVEKTKGTNIHVGAENVHFEKSGAFTGEISADMLLDLGVEYVIVGHSERRQYFAETDQTVNKRALAALNAGLKVILCVGESLEQREEGVTEELVRMQTKIALLGVTAEQMANVVIAYEPVWAIGTGKTATADQAEEVCAQIRKVVGELYGEAVAEASAAARNQVEDARREARRLEGFGKEVGCERRVLARLQNAVVPHQKGGRHLLHDLTQRIVPRGDAGDDADRFARAGGLGEVVVVGELLGQDRKRHDAGDRVVHVEVARKGDRSAELLHFQFRDFVGAGLQIVDHAAHERDAFGHRNLFPGGLRRLGGRDGAVDVFNRAVGHGCEDFPRRGIFDFDLGVARRRRPFSVDELTIETMGHKNSPFGSNRAALGFRRRKSSRLRQSAEGFLRDVRAASRD